MIARSRGEHFARGSHLYAMTSISGSVLVAAVRSAAAGDELAFARIVAVCHEDMLRVAYAVCGDVELARDAVQSAWFIAWRKLHTLRDPERVRPWLVAVAANEARQAVRHRRREPIAELALDPVGDADIVAGAIPRADLANALQHLTPDDRRLLALRYVAGLDSAEIAPLLGISASRVRARLAGVLGRLRRDLD
jgi:RNA polymerase sigma factor (sigma-70 family)